MQPYNDDSSSDDSSSTTSSDEADLQQGNNYNSRRSGFSAIMDDWYGDGDASSAAARSPTPPTTVIKKQQQQQQQQQPTMKVKEKQKIKKKLVPITAAVPKRRTSLNTPQISQRCYLVRGSETQGSLVEYYTVDEAPDEYLACWTPPAGKQIPKFKFTQNWGKNELVNAATQGDLRGKRSYFSGICQWLRKAKTFNGSFRFCNHVPGWECDVYIFLLDAVDGIQTVLVKDGQTFPSAKAEGVAIVSRGADFLYYDPRFQCGFDKWVLEGSKLGYATKLDVRPGCAYPKSIVTHPSILGSQRGSSAVDTTSDDGSNGEPSEEKIDDGDLQSRTKHEIEDEFQQRKSRMTLGTSVYVRDSHYSWIPATIVSEPDIKKKVTVRVGFPGDWEEYTATPKGGEVGKVKLERTINLSDYSNEELPIQNLEADGVSTARKNDMADLANLHEAAILYNLKARHSDGNPYTRVGDIMVAVNPFQWIKGLYSEEKRSFYANNLIWQTTPGGSMRSSQLLATAAAEKQALGYDYEKLGIKPHVYETSSLSYLGLAMDKSDQTILVTGESGAGKTETIKIVMNHLATVEGTRPSLSDLSKSTSRKHGAGTVERVLRANPLFEAFGNAKTLRNDNSSRFGKFTQLQFDVEDHDLAIRDGRHIPICELAGSKCITYLLEKSRVVSVSEGERTFHIFYQMLGAPDTDKEKIWKEGLVGFDTSDFAYLRNAPTSSVDGLASGDNWSETVEALSIFGINGDLLLHVMRSLCVILQLGNLTFGMDVVEGEERSTISSPEVLCKLSSIMGVSEEEIESALTKKSFSMRGEQVTIALKDNEAKDGCDALAKEVS